VRECYVAAICETNWRRPEKCRLPPCKRVLSKSVASSRCMSAWPCPSIVSMFAGPFQSKHLHPPPPNAFGDQCSLVHFTRRTSTRLLQMILDSKSIRAPKTCTSRVHTAGAYCWRGVHLEESCGSGAVFGAPNNSGVGDGRRPDEGTPQGLTTGHHGRYVLGLRTG